MVITRIVSMKSLFRHKHTNDISWVQTDWFALSQQASAQIAVQMTGNGLWQSLTAKQDNTGQVAEKTKRWSPVTNRFAVMDALVNVLGSEVLILHCHENGDCQQPDDRQSERSRVRSELLQSADDCPFGTLTRFVRTPSLPRWRCPGHWLVPWPRPPWPSIFRMFLNDGSCTVPHDWSWGEEGARTFLLVVTRGPCFGVPGLSQIGECSHHGICGGLWVTSLGWRPLLNFDSSLARNVLRSFSQVCLLKQFFYLFS